MPVSPQSATTLPLAAHAARLVEQQADRADRLEAASSRRGRRSRGAVRRRRRFRRNVAIVEHEIGDILGVEQAGLGRSSGSAAAVERQSFEPHHAGVARLEERRRRRERRTRDCPGTPMMWVLFGSAISPTS